jgi:hypothetical protein
MGSAHTDVDAFVAAVTVFDDADTPEAASIAPTLEAVLDRTYYLKQRLPGYRLISFFNPLEAGGIIKEYTGTTYDPAGDYKIIEFAALKDDIICVTSHFMIAGEASSIQTNFALGWSIDAGAVSPGQEIICSLEQYVLPACLTGQILVGGSGTFKLWWRLHSASAGKYARIYGPASTNIELWRETP